MSESEFDHKKINNYLLLYFVIETCGEMVGKKITEVNQFIKSIILDITEISEEEGLSTYIKVMGYGINAYWMMENPVEISDYVWRDLSATGQSKIGEAFKLLTVDLDRIRAKGKNFYPVIIWFSYGHPTDDYKVDLEKLKKQSWFKRAIKIAVPTDTDADKEVLNEFTRNHEAILCADDFRHMLRRIIRITLYDDCAFDPDDYDYPDSFWDVYTKKSSDSN